MQNYDILENDLDEHGHLKQTYPEKIDGDFSCYETDITTLEGVPREVGGDFFCSFTKITSLQHSPQFVGGDFYCSNINNITSLEHAPLIVKGDVSCTQNKIISLEGIGKRYLKEIGGYLNLNNCPIKSNILGIILIKKVRFIRLNMIQEIEHIINRHLQGDMDILECQEELIDKGFKNYAKL